MKRIYTYMCLLLLSVLSFAVTGCDDDDDDDVAKDLIELIVNKPVKKLIGQGEGAKSIEVTDSNIKSFERVARKYNVDFAVKRDKTTEPPKYLVFFKGKDADVIAQAFKEFVKVNEKKQQRPSLRQKLKGLQKIVAQNKNKERSREKNKDKGQSL